jgi:hypothetical protein
MPKLTTMPNINPANFLNWNELSRLLCGHRSTMRKNRIPKVHQPIVNKLLVAVSKILKEKA